jgi:predicted metallopeptidase
MEFKKAPELTKIVKDLIKRLPLPHIKKSQIYCVRSIGSKARAHARIWGLSRIFNFAAGYKTVYIIEVISQHFDKLSKEEKIKTLIHELLHIPKTFSGALLAHRGRYHRVSWREVEEWYKKVM